jgi:prepilin-type N-terminal cleavage/methylation domain-containing protein
MSVRSTSAMRLLAQRLLLGLFTQPVGNPNTTSGLTLLECLVAIVVVSITMVSITPPIFWATATRVQNRRAEQAQAIAQGEVDRVRTLIERGDYVTEQLPPEATGNIRINRPPAPTTSTGKLRAQSPTCNQEAGSQPVPTLTQFVPVNTKGTNTKDPVTSIDQCTPDFLIQTFRSKGEWGEQDLTLRGTKPPDGFVIGVRVYSAVGLTPGGALTEPLQPEQASLRATSGLGNQRNFPLSVLYSVVVRNNSNRSLEIYNRLCPRTVNNGC